uniref:RNA-directed DNA polymerase n=1 Tax=Tanacetum cinerariifolium TaxID=118510 RepID=A0A6L2LS33_TANCI|nr:reverse transcriptase domain-containing protein [Tanacetum cinerariifolium]
MSTRSSARNIFPPLDNPELTIRRRSRADPTLLNDFEMVAEGNSDLPVPDLRTMKELCQPSLNGRGGPIAPISIQATNFGLKNDMIQQVQNSCQFNGLPGDDANKHFDKFLHVTQSIKVNGVTDDALHLYEITNFRQRPDKSLFEAWEHYKLSIDRCLNHNMFPVTQIDTFYNRLTLRHRDTINAAAGGTFMKRRPEEYYDLIENMIAHHNDWDTSAQRSKPTSSITSSSNTENAALKAEMAEINKNLMRLPLAKLRTYMLREPIKEIPTNLKFMKMNTASSLGLGTLPGNTITNPKEELKGITTRSGTAYQGPTIPTTSFSLPPIETPILNSEPVVAPIIEPVVAPVSEPNQKSSIPYLSRLHDQKLRDKANDQREKFFQIFKDLNYNISFTDALILMPKFGPSIKSLLTNKDKLSELARTPLNEHCLVVLLKRLPEKLGDLGKFLIPCDFLGKAECLALADLGASINLMPLSVWKKLSLPELSPMWMTLELVDRLISRPVGVAEDVFVKVGTFHFSADFVVVDFDADPRVPLFLRRPFLKIERALIDVFEGELSLRVGKEAITFNLDQTLRYSANYNDMTANRIDVIDMACEEYSQKVLGFFDVIASGNPTPYYDPIVSTSSLTLTPFGESNFLFEEVDAFLALEDDPTSPKVDHSYVDTEGEIILLEAFLNDDPSLPPPTQGNYLPQVRKELKICEAKTDKSSVDEPSEEKTDLITVLKSHKRVIAWKLSDIKGIDPEFCTHETLMEEDFKPAVQHQRRVNPKIYDVIKNEVLKLLDAGLIYPISDYPWLSPVHCVPKKGGFAVVENEENELILTRLVTGWRVCIDYRKLNEATRKDHFPLPFMDQMFERLAKNEYNCFLDGFSGYFQILIDPKDQEKTTFTCPYRTFAYRRMPFGLCNAPGTFQRCMMAIFHDMIEKTMEVFMDDFSVFGNSFQTCLSHLEKTLKWCEDTNLYLNWEKSHFIVKEGIVLSHKISKNGINIDKAKVDVIAKLPHPTTVKGIRSFLGHAGFYRRFIKDFSKLARPMTRLLEKDTPFFFSKECVEAFQTLKRKLTEAPILISPDWDLPFELMYDASDFTIGAVLGQRQENYFKPIQYASKTMTEAESNYTTTEKEMLAVVYAFEKFRSYLIMNKGIVNTDHSSLKYLFAKKCSNERFLRWVLLLKEFTFKVIDTKGAENLVADHLSRLENPHQNVRDPKEINESFPLETLNMVSSRGSSSTPWFADFSNYHAGNFVVKGMPLSIRESSRRTKNNSVKYKIKNGGQPLPRVTQASIAGTSSTEQPPLKDKSMWSDQEKRIQKIDRLARSLMIQGLLNDIYSLINSNKTAKYLSVALARHMLGSEYGEQDRKAAVLYKYETFKATKGELLLDTYIRYLQVINDLKKCGYSKDNSTIGQTQNVYAAGAYQGNSYQPQGNTITNPKEELKGITTRSGTAYQGPTIPTTSSSLLSVIKTPVLNSKPVVVPIIEPVVAPVSEPNQKSSISYPSRLHDQKLRDKANDQREKYFQIFKDLNYNISFADALILMPKFGPSIKSLLTNKDKISELARTPLNEHCLAVLLKKLLEKLGDPRKFLIPCDFPGKVECLALADLGASINLMPLSVWKKLSLPELSPMCMTLELADRSISRLVGVAEDVFVKVGNFHFPTDFVVIDFDADPREEVLSFSDVIVSGNPTPYYDLIVSTSSPTLTPFGESDFLFEEVDAFLALEDDPTSPKVDHSYVDTEGDIILLEAFLNDDPSLPPPTQGNYLPQVRKELKICEAKADKSLIDEPPEVELKDLPPYLEYAFLEGDDKFPVIIAKDLSVEEKTALITVLKSHKRAIAWKLSDIKGIDPEFCTHKILIEENFEPAVQDHRRVNPKIHDVIKNEVLKLLDAGLIYPISDSHWVSPVHCVPKKGGFAIVENEENELILTRLVTGWRVCIDYRKLNEATQKTTFTCPYRTFAYRRMPFGLCNAPSTFQRCMMAIFHDMIEKTMEVFMDDFSVFGNSFQTCLSHLEKTLKRCEDSNLYLNWEKSHFMVKEGIVLGHKISKNGIEVDKAKVDVIAKLPHPTTVKGAVRGKRQEKNFRPIQYASKIMTDAESNYSTTEKEMLAVVYAFEKFRSYLIMNKNIVYTDHSALKYLFTKKYSKERFHRWVLLLQEFTFKVINTKGAENLVTDHLSRLENPHQNVLDPKEINESFPLETLNMVSSRGNSSTPWFADFSNYHAGNFVVKGMSSQQKNKFFKDGIDFMGPFSSLRGNKYILVAVDYLSKWVEAKALPTNDARIVYKFLKSLFARFRTPRATISDRGTYFCNDRFAKVMLKYGVTHRLAIAYHPQTSGEVEGLKHVNFDLQTAGDHRKVQLNELNKLCDQAYENSLIYKEKTKRLHDSKIKDRIFNVGDRVLLFNSRMKIFSGKLKTRWSGPFTISHVFPYGIVELSQTDGPNFKVNGHRLKHYFGEDIPKMVVPDL